MAFTWTTINVNDIIRADHINEVKTNLDTLFSWEGVTWSWQYLPVSAGQMITDEVFQELRNATDYADDNKCLTDNATHDATVNSTNDSTVNSTYNGGDDTTNNTTENTSYYTGDNSPHDTTVNGTNNVSENTGYNSAEDSGDNAGDYSGYDSGVNSSYTCNTVNYAV